MKIGIIVYSFTGNTLAAAEDIKERFLKKGVEVSIEIIETEESDPIKAKSINLKTIPDVSSYDAVIFGSPVWGFSLSSVMSKYLKQLPSLEGKKVGGFVTQHLPYAWMGGNRSLKQISKLCEAKGKSIEQGGILRWKDETKDAMLEQLFEKLSKLV